MKLNGAVLPSVYVHFKQSTARGPITAESKLEGATTAYLFQYLSVKFTGGRVKDEIPKRVMENFR